MQNFQILCRIASPHPSKAAVACYTARTPDDMADTRCCHCCLPASRPAQATTIKTTRETEVTRQRQPRKVYTCQHQSISQHNVKITSQKLRMRPLGGGRPPPTAPPWLRHWYHSIHNYAVVVRYASDYYCCV